MRALVLAYHSHNIAGTGYESNDHVAFASDLRSVHAAGARIVPLAAIADAVRVGLPGGDELLVGLSFDDGPRFDYDDFVHPRFGPQRGFLGVMRDFQAEAGAGAQPELHATSFVIASPGARLAMAVSPGCGYPDLPGWLDDDWWQPAVESGLMGIGNHSWDHVHHEVDPIAAGAGRHDDFTSVASYADADSEIRAASEFINSRVGGRCSLFAYPFGHVNEFLVRDYLPMRAHEHGMTAAFGTGGREMRSGDSIWNLPRFVCGEHWRSPAELEAILRP